MTYHEQRAASGPFGRVLRLMGPSQRVLAFIVIPLAFAAILQAVTQIIVMVLTGNRRAEVLSILEYIGLWGAADPANRYGVAGAAALHWAIVTVLAGGAVGGIITGIRFRARRLKNPQRRFGIAERAEAEENLGAAQLVTKHAAVLRPGLAGQKIVPRQVGYRVGEFRGGEIWLRVEDPTIIIGPSRAGKGWYLILNWILDAPGAVITTSSKLDNAAMTMEERKRIGSTVWIFAPGVPGGKDFGHVLKWNPVDGCVDEETLVRRIKALIPDDAFSGSTTNGGHWDTLGQQLAAHLFHAAACAGLGVDAIWGWVSSPQRAADAVRHIREHPDGMVEHAAHLESVLNMPPEQRASQWGVLPTALAFLESRSAREWMTPEPGTEIDLVDFVLNRGTLYLVGDKQASKGYLRILDGLLAEVDHVTKGLAAASPGGRLDPPVTYLLDEAGNIEYQGLYELITAGGGRGRVGVAVFQSKAQLQQYGGQDAADTLWDAATAKIVLPGGGDPRALDDMSKLIGEIWVERESHQLGGGPGSVQLSAEKRSIFDASEIRTLESGFAYLFYRNLRPLLPKCRPFSEHPRYAACVRDAKALEQRTQQASPYAAQLEAYAEKHRA